MPPPPRRRPPGRRAGTLALLLIAGGVLHRRCRRPPPSASAFAARSSAISAMAERRRRRLLLPPAALPLRSRRPPAAAAAAAAADANVSTEAFRRGGKLMAERGGGGGGGGNGGGEGGARGSSEQQQPKSDPGLSAEGMAFMALLALQFGVQPSLVKSFTPRGVVKSSVVLVQEMVKFVIASALYFGGTSEEKRRADLAGMSIWTWLKIAALPAALYNVQNIASLLAYQNLEPLTFNVLNQTKTLSAALCCYLVIGRKQSGVQMFSLTLLLVAALIIEKLVTIGALASPFSSSGGTTTGLFATAGLFAEDGSMKLARHVTHGVFPILLASFISGLAGAIVQKNLQGASKSGKKKRLPRNPYLFNMELNSASAILLVASMLVSGDGRRIAESGFFHQWTPRTMIPILTNAVGGIIVALVTKYAGAVRKGFALIFGILISGLIQAETVGISKEQVVGGALAAVSLYLHTMYPIKAKAEASTSSSGGEEKEKGKA